MPAYAITSFALATEYNPAFREARFERGRALVALRDYDLAINDFHQLVREKHDPAYMEYIAYCFNLKRVSVAAIPWYEMAAQKGAMTTELANNLGASYIEASSRLSKKERLERSESLLSKALEADPLSLAVHVNLLRLSVAKASHNKSYDPFDDRRHALYLMDKFPGDEFAESQMAVWYQSVLIYEKSKSKQINSTNSSPTEYAAYKRLEEIHAKVRFRTRDNQLAFESAGDKTPHRAERYFLAPKSTPQ